MSKNPRKKPLRFDTLLKAIFEAAAPELLTTRDFSIALQKPLSTELAKLSIKLIPDFLYLANYQTPLKSEPCILHLEFQTKNDPQMPYRMGEYHFRIKRDSKYQKYKILQFLIYFGTAENRMEGSYNHEIDGCQLAYRYNVIDTNLQDGVKYLEADNPDVNLWGFLCNLSAADNLAERLETFLKKVREKDRDTFEEYLAEIIVIAEIRNFSTEFKEVCQKMDLEIDLNRLPLYKDAYMEGKREGKREGELKGKLEGKLEDIKKILSIKFPENEAQVVRLSERIEQIKDMEIIDKLMDNAVKAKSVEDFEETLSKLV